MVFTNFRKDACKILTESTVLPEAGIVKEIAAQSSGILRDAVANFNDLKNAIYGAESRRF